MPDLDIKEALKRSVFTFLIGKEEERIDVHPKVISELSKPLAALMNNGLMRESLERTAKLPETEPSTFALFLEYAYTGKYTITPAQETMELNTTTPAPPGTWCGFCGHRLDDNSCDLCCLAERFHGVGPMACDGCGLSIGDCIQEESTCIPALERPHHCRDARFLYENLPVEHEPVRDIKMPKASTLALLVKLYTFADKYMVDKLREKTLQMLRVDLCFISLARTNIDGVMDMIRFINAELGQEYAPDSDKHPLLALVCDYMVFEARKLVSYKQFQRDFLATGSPLITDFTIKAISNLPQ